MQAALQYFILGFAHVIPAGADHILFILGIFFLNSRLRSVIVQCSVFTLAHSITLGLAAAGLIFPDARVVEPLIAASIFFVAIENILGQRVNVWRLATIFIFGLVHGLGFATALRDAGIPRQHFLLSLLCFNVGVEAGQVVVILAAWLFLAHWFRHRTWYQRGIVLPVSTLIACIALFWTVERIMGGL
jgi:hypothetical protein